MLTLKGDLEQVLNLTLEMLNDQLGRGGEASSSGDAGAAEAEEEAEAAYNKPKKKSRWAEPAPILPIKPWQVGENCQALYSGIVCENLLDRISSVLVWFNSFQETAHIMMLK